VTRISAPLPKLPSGQTATPASRTGTPCRDNLTISPTPAVAPRLVGRSAIYSISGIGRHVPPSSKGIATASPKNVPSIASTRRSKISSPEPSVRR
jgi:hypothetical protein